MARSVLDACSRYTAKKYTAAAHELKNKRANSQIILDRGELRSTFSKKYSMPSKRYTPAASTIATATKKAINVGVLICKVRPSGRDLANTVANRTAPIPITVIYAVMVKLFSILEVASWRVAGTFVSVLPVDMTAGRIVPRR